MNRFLGISAAVLGMGLMLCGCSGTFGAPDQEGTTVAVTDEQYIPFRRIPANAVYSTETTIGAKFELNLGEDPANGIRWKIVSYTMPLCLVRIEHDQDGFWPFLRDEAEITVLLKRPGVSSVTLQCPGKTVNLLIKAQ